LVGAILNILCPQEWRVFQSKLGVSSSNQCNLHHSPHTGHLGKKKIKKRVQSFSDTVYYRILEFIPVLDIFIAAWFSKWWFLGKYAEQT